MKRPAPPETQFPPSMNALYYKAAYWVGKDVFKIFTEGYLAPQTILKHWVVRGISVNMHERLNPFGDYFALA